MRKMNERRLAQQISWGETRKEEIDFEKDSSEDEKVVVVGLSVPLPARLEEIDDSR